MTREERLPYEELQIKDKLRHEKQLQELKEHGYFIMDDGRKSSEVRRPTPIKRKASHKKQKN